MPAPVRSGFVSVLTAALHSWARRPWFGVRFPAARLYDRLLWEGPPPRQESCAIPAPGPAAPRSPGRAGGLPAARPGRRGQGPARPGPLGLDEIGRAARREGPETLSVRGES